MSEEAAGFIKFLGTVVLVIVLLMGSCAALEVTTAAIASKLSCNEFAAINSDYEFRWDFLTGCKMKTSDGFWIDTSLIRYTDGKIVFEQE